MRNATTLPLLALVLLVAGAAPALADDITLSLGPPELCACGWVSVNGAVSSDRTVWDLVWDWGDGTSSVSWFPASHRYAADGRYTITVTAIGCSSEVEVAQAEVSGAEGPGCPSDDAPPCHAARPCRYLHPYNMHLVDDATGPVPLHLCDAAGTPTPEALSFDPGDPSLLSIAPDGAVTALRTEGPSEIGAWASATLVDEGRPAANNSVVRVLPQACTVPFAEAVAGETVLWYPLSVAGEGLGALVAQHEIPTVNSTRTRSKGAFSRSSRTAAAGRSSPSTSASPRRGASAGSPATRSGWGGTSQGTPGRTASWSRSCRRAARSGSSSTTSWGTTSPGPRRSSRGCWGSASIPRGWPRRWR